VRATTVPGSPELAKNEGEGMASSLVRLWPRDRVREWRIAEGGLRAGPVTLVRDSGRGEGV
jgi:hypothetical protein